MKPRMQRLRDKRKDLRSSFMSHFLACDDKSCTRLNDLLDRIFFEGKARHGTKTYFRLSLVSAVTSDSRKYVCVRRLLFISFGIAFKNVMVGEMKK